MRWPLAHVKAGDYLTIAAGCALTVFLTLNLWQSDRADRAIIDKKLGAAGLKKQDFQSMGGQ
ncbi:MAG: hypothetical protein V4443_12020 [Pseudomonadota bacterium]